MSIRLRLTLWYTTILATVLVIFGAALYYLLTLTLLRSIDDQLQATANVVAESARVSLSPLSMDQIIEFPDLNLLAPPGVYIQVFHMDSGQIVERSETLGEVALPLDEETIDKALAGESDIQTISLGEQRLRALSVPLSARGRIEGIIQVATGLAQVDQTQRQLLGIEVAGGLLAVIVAAALGALLARAALRPIDDITQTALAICRTEDLSRRLAVSGPPDEVGRLVATFNEMLTRLDALFRAQRRFTADVSHELRTPLTTIQGNLDLLRRGAADVPGVRHEVLSNIDDQVSRMSRLVADLLLLARADAGVSIEMEQVELDTLLLDVYRQARVMSDGVEVKLGHEDQATVYGDRDRLRQLLLNLVDNALKYTPKGGQVTLSLFREEKDVRIVVEDTGMGILPEALAPGPGGCPLIFERFYRSDPARSSGGSGLGLSIVHWIAQAHGGTVEVESQVGEGSTFTVKLPSHHSP
ncbi:MAG: HAMP domain-containing protein [Anaerolineae bacterium]|nr:HAMP domain-containing protein [Anaerolineae bacterium]